MFKVGDEVVLPLIIEKSCSEEIVGAKSEDGVVHIYKIEEAKRLLKPRESKTYTQGLADAWELADKVYEMRNQQRYDVFGTESLAKVMDLSPEEALAKIEAYEKEKSVCVGDVVSFEDETKALVVDEGLEDTVFVLTENGCIERWERKFLEKTNKQISISDLLRQIGE